eukprot:TRINITY_DN8520_c0_g1_i5.p1 TRINITY_DN8520_c0_g1~~TRINITY_DN8520_c0_g1_i5.p1  ORF type:complete len:184 (-),score=21.59 TRINITY_DN8520_c0_g1_i5:25-576(-)
MERLLFGGAFQIHLPEEFVDISQFRDVPDNQEVFADAKTDRSVQIEIVEPADASDEGCSRFYFEALAKDSEALEPTLSQSGALSCADLPNLENHIHKSFALGRMKISKGRESSEAANLIEVYIAVIRLKEFSSDILLTINVPIQFSELSASCQGCEIASTESNRDLLRICLSSFKINNYSIFG